MPITPVIGQPGMQSVQTASQRVVFKSKYGEMYLPGGKLIKGSKSGDPGNTGDVRRLRAGMLMGMDSTNKYWAPTIIGVLNSAYTSGGTTLTVDAAVVTEIVRRVGASGSLKCVGPPTAAGTVAVTSVTYSAASGTTITVTSLGVDKIAGSFICAADGTQTPLAFLPDGWATQVVDQYGTDADVDFPMIPVGGIVWSSQLINWPTDTSLQAWVVSSLCASGVGHFTFDHLYQ
jgi:hypothetical protein